MKRWGTKTLEYHDQFIADVVQALKNNGLGTSNKRHKYVRAIQKNLKQLDKIIDKLWDEYVWK